MLMFLEYVASKRQNLIYSTANNEKFININLYHITLYKTQDIMSIFRFTLLVFICFASLALATKVNHLAMETDALRVFTILNTMMKEY